MENLLESRENAKRMVAYYDREITKADKRIKLLTMMEEMEEAKKVDLERKHLLTQLEHFKNYETAMNYYMEHNLQEA